MFDVFYIGKKPGLFAHEREAENILQARDMCRTRYFWIVNYLADYSDFDFLWEPVPWESHQRHAWASQWQKDCGTYLVPRLGYSDTNYHEQKILMTTDMQRWNNADSVEEFDFSWHPDYSDPPFHYEFGTQWQKTGGPRYSMPGAEQTKYVSQSGSRTRAKATAIYLIDHLDGTVDDFAGMATKKIRYFDNYKDTLTRLAKSVPDDQEFVWICSSICDYANFDFSWHPETWQNHMLHVFPSNLEKFGDTFFMHVPTFRAKIESFDLLEWYDLNFVSDISVPRRSLPTVTHDFDSHVDAIRVRDWNGPLCLFTAPEIFLDDVPIIPLWRAKTKTVVPLTPGASAVIIPKIAVPEISKQIYDYPYIDKNHRHSGKDPQQDVIFISNGEPMADRHWQHLQELFPAAKHSQGVLGREAAYKAAASMSTTPWFFAVFAKTEVLPQFNFGFQPDRLQAPKHYIFHSRNPLNGLEYGAMNINLYNRQLVLDTKPGLDFTLSSCHEVVPICASISRFNTDPWITWRSAFREVLKLKQEVVQGADIEIQHRLHVWCTYAEGENAEHCLQGSADALRFFAQVQGEPKELQKSFDWYWLQDYYYSLYGQRPWLEV